MCQVRSVVSMGVYVLLPIVRILVPVIGSLIGIERIVFRAIANFTASEQVVDVNNL